MSKGISKSKELAQQIKKAELNVLVQMKAKIFPGTEILIPKGITVRSENGVQVEFMYEGKRCYETIKGRPTVGHVLAAIEKRERVIQLIGLREFSYEKEFPDSPRVRSLLAEEDEFTQQKIGQTVGTALDAWLVTATPSVGHNAAKDYTKDSSLLKKIPLSALTGSESAVLKNDVLGDFPVDKLDDVAITRLMAWLLAKPGAKLGTTLSEKRVRNIMTPLRGAMNRLALKNLIKHDPFNLVRPVRKRKTVTTNAGITIESNLDAPLPILDGNPTQEEDVSVEPFTPAEVKAILSQLSGPFLNLMTFWFWTGLRTGELIALRWSDVDWKSRKIYVRRSLSRGHLKLPKFDKKRWVTLCEPAFKALEEQFKFSGDGDGWAFPNPYTEKMWANESKIRTRFAKALELAGVRYRRPYNCRHTYASTMLSAGENPMYVAQQMGHKDWSMLIKVYGRWIEDVDLQAGQRIAKMQETLWTEMAELVRSRQMKTEDDHTDKVENDGDAVTDDEELEF